MAVRFKQNAPHPLVVNLANLDGDVVGEYESDGKTFISVLFPDYGTAANIPSEQLYNPDDPEADTVYEPEDKPTLFSRLMGIFK